MTVSLLLALLAIILAIAGGILKNFWLVASALILVAAIWLLRAVHIGA
jgi:hypothetical protein